MVAPSLKEEHLAPSPARMHSCNIELAAPFFPHSLSQLMFWGMCSAHELYDRSMRCAHELYNREKSIFGFWPKKLTCSSIRLLGGRLRIQLKLSLDYGVRPFLDNRIESLQWSVGKTGITIYQSN